MTAKRKQGKQHKVDEPYRRNMPERTEKPV
jgi:hypothetical protein